MGMTHPAPAFLTYPAPQKGGLESMERGRFAHFTDRLTPVYVVARRAARRLLDAVGPDRLAGITENDTLIPAIQGQQLSTLRVALRKLELRDQLLHDGEHEEDRQGVLERDRLPLWHCHRPARNERRS